MKTVLKGLTTAALLAAAVTAPASAQMKSWGFGVHGAYFKSGSLAHSDVTDTRLQLDNKRTIGGNIEFWPSYRLGLRANFDHTNSPWILDNDDATGVDATRIGGAQAQLDATGKNVDVVMADANLVLRLLTPTVDRRFAPFLSLGGGLMKWDHQTDSQPVNITVDEADVQIQGNKQSEFVATGSVGADLFVTNSVALRLEAKDYFSPSSPYIQVSQSSATDSRHHSGVHNMVYSVGLNFLFGGNRVQEPGFIAQAPPPPPPPAPAPAPAPRPTTEQLAMCVVGTNGQLEMVTATRNLDSREIFVTRNGSQTAFAVAYPTSDPWYVRNSSWYVASRPLIIDLDPNPATRTDADVALPTNRIELVNFGSTMPIASTDVIYVGSVNGTPLYAKRADVSADLMPDLQAKLRTNSDLEVILTDRAFADRYTASIPTFYLAVEPNAKDCVFQPVSSTRVVRRTRG